MKCIIAFMVLLFIGNTINAEEIGSVDTTFKLLGSNHKIVSR